LGKTKHVRAKEAKTQKPGRSGRKVKMFGILVRKLRIIGNILAKAKIFGMILAKPEIFVITMRELHISGKARGKSKFFWHNSGKI